MRRWCDDAWVFPYLLSTLYDEGGGGQPVYNLRDLVMIETDGVDNDCLESRLTELNHLSVTHRLTSTCTTTEKP